MTGAGTGWVVVLLVLVLFVLLPMLLLRSGRRSARSASFPAAQPYGWQDEPAALQGWQVPEARAVPPVVAADVVSLRDRLGHDVRTLEPGADPVARQALADASERHATCSVLLERAGSQPQLRTAWLAAVEGLTAARVVRARLGLDAGPEIPLPPGTGPQLTRHTPVVVGGTEHVGAPTYEPGRPHWFPGGAYGGRPVPGGWYAEPFWPTVLAAGAFGALGGLALGGLAAGSAYPDPAAGDDPGADLDVDADSAGDWGAGGGGGGWDDDGGWRGGGGGGWEAGGDWGGFGGGGDWGGVGDFGGDFGGDVGGGGDW